MKLIILLFFHTEKIVNDKHIFIYFVVHDSYQPELEHVDGRHVRIMRYAYPPPGLPRVHIANQATIHTPVQLRLSEDDDQQTTQTSFQGNFIKIIFNISLSIFK